MKILLTGNGGFLGKAVLREVEKNNEVITLSRQSGILRFDLAEGVSRFSQPFDLVIHAAGKAHSIPKTESEKQAFFEVNTKGTANLVAALEAKPPEAFVFISSVSVYGRETGSMISESDALNASDPYGRSKIEAEQIVQTWCQRKGVTCAILRLPLLAGPNPPGNLGAMIRGIKKGYYFNIAEGTAKKSMVLASDVAKIIPTAAKKGGIFNLTDGVHPSFAELSKSIALQLGKNEPKSLPGTLASLVAKIGDIIPKFPLNTNKLVKITSDLTFDDQKARQILNWQPTSVLEGFKISD